jgi:hypothetical protein
MTFLTRFPAGFTVAAGGLEAAIRQSLGFLYAHTGTHDRASLSRALIDDREAGGQLAAETQDAFVASDVFAEIVASAPMRGFAADLVGCREADLVTAFPHLRIDLPTRFSADEKRLNLPWHQEADYYLPKGDCSTKSLVISTPLFDCKASDGALVVGPGSHLEGYEPHSTVFMDEARQRHKRVICTPPAEEVVAETVQGESQVITFLLKHRSGVNEGPFVRCTMLLRVGARQDIDAEAS